MLIGYIQRDQSKVFIALPTSNNIMEIFEKTLPGGFSSINTRSASDTKMLMPNNKLIDYNKLNINESFKFFKRIYLKIIHRLKFNYYKKYERRHVILGSISSSNSIVLIIKLDFNQDSGGFSFVQSIGKGVAQILANIEFNDIDFSRY